jgi:hypothetical protein
VLLLRFHHHTPQAEAQLQEYLQFGEDFQGIVQEYGGVLVSWDVWKGMLQC